MQVVIANYSGFCFGVERAIDIVQKSQEKSSHVATFGPIIHNPQVVKSLLDNGVSVVEDISDIDNTQDIIIRSHGVEKHIRNILEQKAKNVIDATCPFVLKAQSTASTLSKNCDAVIILGEKEHPEVKGIISYIPGEYFIISNADDAKSLPFRQKYAFIAQTTQNKETFLKISDIVKDKCDELVAVNTICNATGQRQKASVALAHNVEVMIVVGGKNSANTTRLYHLCKAICNKSYHIETIDELSSDMFFNVSTVGLTAGASTPKDYLHKVREYILEVSK